MYRTKSNQNIKNVKADKTTAPSNRLSKSDVEDVFLEIFSDDQKNQTAIKTILLKIHDKYARFSSLVLYDT